VAGQLSDHALLEHEYTRHGAQRDDGKREEEAVLDEAAEEARRLDRRLAAALELGDSRRQMCPLQCQRAEISPTCTPTTTYHYGGLRRRCIVGALLEQLQPARVRPRRGALRKQLQGAARVAVDLRHAVKEGGAAVLQAILVEQLLQQLDFPRKRR
jgi:hypothetical protein